MGGDNKVEDREIEEPEVVKSLKALDDEYLALERQCATEILAIQRKYMRDQQPVLDKRAEMLAEAPNEDNKGATGTPALEGFWLKALQNHPEVGDNIHDHDEPVLKYLQDIRFEVLFDEPVAPHPPISWRECGHRVIFTFAENPWFCNAELSVEWKTEERSPYTGETEVVAIKASSIEWRTGKNVTVEVVSKTKKGKKDKNSKKKAAEKGGKEEPRKSFFRTLFRSLKLEDPLPEAAAELDLESMDSEDDLCEDDMVGRIMDDSYDIGCSLRDCVIPFAVRWYTGEACEDDSDDDEGEESEEEDSDKEEDSDEDARAPSRRGRKPGKD